MINYWKNLADEQVKMIQQIIDATFWMKVFAQNKEEVTRN